MDSLLQLLRIPQVAFILNIEPKSRRLSEISPKPKRRIQRDCPLIVDDFINPSRSNVQRPGERILGKPHRFHIVFQQDFSRRDIFQIYAAHDRLMVIDNFYIMHIAFLPEEANAPLVVYPNAVPAPSIPLQGFQAICRRHPQVIQAFRLIKGDELSQGRALYIRGQSLGRNALPNLLGRFRAERMNHPHTL